MTLIGQSRLHPPTRRTYAGHLRALRVICEADLAKSESVAARLWERSLNYFTCTTAGRQPQPCRASCPTLPRRHPRQLRAPDVIKDAPVLGGLTPFQVTMALASLADYSLITLDTDAIAVHHVIQHLTRLDAETRDLAIGYCTAAIEILNASL